LPSILREKATHLPPFVLPTASSLFLSAHRSFLNSFLPHPQPSLFNMSRAYAQPSPSTSRSISSPTSPQAPPKEFKPACKCPDPDCNVEQIATKFNKYFGYSNNTAIALVAQMKELSTLTGVAPGVRQAAGGLLIVLETIGVSPTSSFYATCLTERHCLVDEGHGCTF
jgi:hypothetical protein